MISNFKSNLMILIVLSELLEYSIFVEHYISCIRRMRFLWKFVL